MRVPWARLGGVLGCLTGLAGLIAPAAGAGQAVTYQQNAAHTGFAREPSLAPPLRRVWVRAFRGRVSYPVIADGRVFVIDLSPDGEVPARVVALSVRTGRVLWRHELPADGGTLGYEDGRLFVSMHFARGDVGFEALRARDGSVLWFKPYGVGIGGQPPVPFDGAVYLGLGDFIHALSASDGRLLWESFPDPRGGSFWAPAVAGDRVYVVSGCDNAYALGRLDGRVIWSREGPCYGGSFQTATVYRDTLFSDMGSEGHVYDARDGAAERLLPPHMRAPAAFARGLSVGPEGFPPPSAGPGHTIVARSARSGRVVWRFRGDGYLDGGPVIVGRTVYVGSGSGSMYGLSLRTGRVVWRDRIGFPVPHPLVGLTRSIPAAGEGTLVVPALRRLVAYR